MQASRTVAAWLAANPKIVMLVNEVIDHVRGIFGDEPEITLKEAPAGLLGGGRSPADHRLVFRFQDHPIEVDDKLRHFLDDEWWETIMPRAKNQLAFRFEFWYSECSPKFIHIEVDPS